MAQRVGLPEFCPTTDSITHYLQRVELYFKAHKVEATLQVATLLSSIGAATYARLSDLMAPTEPGSKSLDEVTAALKKHFEPKKVQIAERFHFRKREQAAGETVAEFDAILRKLALHCDFGTNLETELRDQIVCGLRNESMQRRLLTEADLSYQKVMDLAQATELAERHAKGLQPSTASVHYSTPRKYTKPRNFTPSQGQPRDCYRCGGRHKPSECKFKDSKCHYCQKIGHLARCCRLKLQQANNKQTTPGTGGQRQTNQVLRDSDSTDSIYHVIRKSKPPYQIGVSVNDAPLQMELDTGAAMTLISEKTYLELKKVLPKMRPTTTRLRTYSGQQLVVLGTLKVTVKYEAQKVVLSLLVVEGSGPSLLGRDWLSQLKLNWKSLSVHYAQSVRSLEEILAKHTGLFDSELGKAKSVEAKLHLDPNATPRFCKARPVPHALREKVENELSRLEADGIIEPVQFSEWAAPVVPVLKQDGSIRICGDYKLTINKAAKLDPYPLPKIEDLFARLAGGKKFSKLDIAHAYQQIPLDEDSKNSVTINTHKGLYQYNRLPFGVHSAPAIFQRAMEGLLRDIPSTVVYLDDILVTGKTEVEHLENLEAVLTRLEDEGLTLKKPKCQFFLEEVEYLGHKISAAGLQPSDRKIQAIIDAPQPQDVTQVRAFLGMVNYYGKFLDHLSTRLTPLYRLLKKNIRWTWGPAEKEAFELVKSQLAQSPILEHYDPAKRLSLSTDASPYGVGAVLSHVLDDGTEKPIAYASRKLNDVEKRYAQIDKEALAIIFGVKRFHQYLYGRRFSICSDHKPLQYLLSESKAIPTMASARLRRWALILSAYQYSISYRPGEKMANADGLSRLPLPDIPTKATVPQEVVFLLQTLQDSPITAEQVKRWTDKDPILSRIRNLVAKGWSGDIVEDTLTPYQQRKAELSLLDGCVLWGTRVIVPLAGRQQVLDLLHDCHPGITKMKLLARQVVWWPGIDNDLTNKVQSCEACQLNQKNPTTSPLHPWEWPKKPWSRIHIDHLGPFQGKTILVIIDAHSK